MYESRLTFRFDDVSVNTDAVLLQNLIKTIREHRPEARILLAVSPVVFSQSQLPALQEQRVHPRILTAGSLLDPYYRGEQCGIPVLPIDDNIIYAGHGIVHVDHRLLNRQSQEISILVSCSLAKARVFVPPYNKWNDDTAAICKTFGIELVQFEHGWRHAMHNPYDSEHERFYMHPYDMTVAELKEWFTR